MITNRIPLGRAHMLASIAIGDAKRAGLPVDRLVLLGSVRRFAPDIGDVALLGVTDLDDHQAALDGFARLRLVARVLARTPSSLEVLTDRGGRMKLIVTAPEQAGAALAWHTGSRRHTGKLQVRARERGLSFQDGRLRRADGSEVATASEEELYRQLALPYIPPELREGEDEIDAAERGQLPKLVSEAHIRGDLHMHTNWSDGRNSLEEMVVAATRLGYEYVAITDHSERSLASRTLASHEIAMQRDAIEALRDRVPSIRILHGVEVDIMHDGSLDFDDAQLESFDIVLASLHDHGGHESDWLTERYLRAMRHPLVNVITHPANRSPAVSMGYDLDYERLFAAAVETGTAMEVDGAPGHLDMDGALARQAALAGVTLTIDSDCHRVEALGRQMRFGIGTARRGWVQPAHVLNTRDVDAVHAFVQRKRAGR